MQEPDELPWKEKAGSGYMRSRYSDFHRAAEQSDFYDLKVWWRDFRKLKIRMRPSGQYQIPYLHPAGSRNNHKGLQPAT